MELGYILAAIFALIWIAFEIVVFLHKKKTEKNFEDNKDKE